LLIPILCAITSIVSLGTMLIFTYTNWNPIVVWDLMWVRSDGGRWWVSKWMKDALMLVRSFFLCKVILILILVELNRSSSF
jgi:hypothetical protein